MNAAASRRPASAENCSAARTSRQCSLAAAGKRSTASGRESPRASASQMRVAASWPSPRDGRRSITRTSASVARLGSLKTAKYASSVSCAPAASNSSSGPEIRTPDAAAARAYGRSALIVRPSTAMSAREYATSLRASSRAPSSCSDSR